MKRHPIPSSAFDCFSPVSIASVREFYQRWHAQGGQSAYNCAGIMRRARDYRDLRNTDDRRQWQELDWKLSRCRADQHMREIGEQRLQNVIRGKFPQSSR